MLKYFRNNVILIILILFFTGCIRGEKGVLNIVNRTGHEFFYVYAITSQDSFPHWPWTIREDSMKLAMLKNGETARIVMPPTFKTTDRITLEMYTLDTIGSERLYKFKLEQTAMIKFLEKIFGDLGLSLVYP